MNDPIKHHYVTQFLLSQWCRDDGRLAVYSRKNDQLVTDWLSPKHTGFERNLYSISALPANDQQWVERKIMSEQVDGPAASVFQRLLNGELSQLNSDERSAWVRFILAQWIRTPDAINSLRKNSEIALIAALEKDPEEYAEIRGDAPETTLVDWIENHSPGLHEIVAMGRVLPRLITDETAGNDIINMRWEVFHLLQDSIDLITSDQPVGRLEGLKSRDCLIVIPLGPQRLFVASYYDRGLNRSNSNKLAKAVNKTMAQAARTRVFASSERHRKLIDKWLGHDRKRLTQTPA